MIQDEAGFIEDREKYERIRVVSPEIPNAFYQKAAQLGKYIVDRKPLVEGRIELLHYLKEQSIACEYHRYGSVFGEKK
jgi:RHH-type proline utilization regulon transcriptional repressor/proline dehydrogenase/delta 1-pyrroline-5-carboxylate dehydrogenase